MSTLNITIELADDGVRKGWDAYTAIGRSDVPLYLGGIAAGIFRDSEGHVVGKWVVTA